MVSYKKIIDYCKQELGDRVLHTYIEDHEHGKTLIDKLLADGIIVDWREPNIIRLAPAPLYNTFSDVHEFANRFGKHCIDLFGEQ